MATKKAKKRKNTKARKNVKSSTKKSPKKTNTSVKKSNKTGTKSTKEEVKESKSTKSIVKEPVKRESKSTNVKKAVEKNTDNNKEKSIIKKSNVTTTKPVNTRAKKITKKTDYSNKKKIVDTKEINIEELVKNSGSKGTRSKKVSKARAIARTKNSSVLSSIKRLQRKIKIYGIFSVIPKHSLAVILCGIVIFLSLLVGIKVAFKPMEKLDLELIASEIDQLKTVKFDINEADSIVTNSKAYDTSKLKEYYEYDYKNMLKLDSNNIAEIKFRYNKDNKQLFLVVKPKENQDETVKNAISSFISTNKIDCYTADYDGYHFYINSTNNLAVMSKAKQTQIRVFDILREYKKDDIEDKFGIDTSWCSDYMVKNAMIVSKVTGYMIIKPKNSSGAKKIDKAMEEYYQNLESKLTEENDNEKLNLVQNRYKGVYNGYLVYIVSRNNSLVMDLIKK